MAYEAATKEESSRNSQADNSRPSESKGICSDGSVVSIGVKNIASFDKCDSIGVSALGNKHRRKPYVMRIAARRVQKLAMPVRAPAKAEPSLVKENRPQKMAKIAKISPRR
jgi:hypothetical protein